MMVTKIELETLKIEQEERASVRDFWRTIIVSGAAVIIVGALSTFGSIYVAFLQGESAQQVELIKVASLKEVELIKIDADLVKSFSEDFLSEDIGTRIRASHLIKSIAPTPEIKSRWTNYHSELTELFNAIIDKGKKPGEDILDLFKDPNFRRSYGGIGCRADSFGGCWAQQPPINLHDGLVKG